MKNKVCLVTGATSGIGEEAAVQLAREGAQTILLTGRDPARGEAAAARCRAAGAGAAEFLPTDFASLASVRALAGEVRRRCDRLDVLVNNAGLVSAGRARRLSADGFELTFAVNHLATFLLTHELLGLLTAGASARVVTVSSEAHRSLREVPFDNLQGERRYRPFLAYSQSKLENVLFTYELARRLEKEHRAVTATCLHPGVVRTRIWQNAGGGLLGFLIMLGKPLMISSARGGAAVARLAGSPALAGVTGRYFNREREAESSAASHDEAAAARLWEISAGMTGAA